MGRNTAGGTATRERHTGRSRQAVDRRRIAEVLSGCHEPLSLKQLSARLEVRAGARMEALQNCLGQMEREGEVVRNRRGGYGLAQKMDLVRGRIIGHPDGYGFLVTDEGGPDVFLSAREMRALFHGDRIVARVTGLDRRGRREGSLVEVLERNTHQVVGRFHERGGVGFVVSDNKRISQEIVISSAAQAGARDGQIVVATIVEQPTVVSQPVGQVAEILGDHMAPGMEIETAIRSYELPNEWPEAVLREAARIPHQVAITPERADLRALPLVTIDGVDAKDFDDAVYCEPRTAGWRVVVAIADVSWYVQPGTALDSQARLRGNSVYFPGQVIPMLPEVLSTGLCSLNPQVDRYCLACEMFIDTAGKVTRSSFMRGIMHSAARLTYEEVDGLLTGRDTRARKARAALLPHIQNLYAVYRALRGARERRGAIDFDTTETRIVFGQGRKIERIVPVQRTDAHRLIEECMLASNMAAARWLERHKVPTLYRVHEGPSADKLNDLRAWLAEIGLSLGGGEQPEPRHFAEMLNQVRSRPDSHVIQTVMLRSLSQAVYATENIGHFGLASAAYLHFTSPIRRYPDLLVHRAICHVLEAKKPDRLFGDDRDLQADADHCSMTERRADEATRDAVNWLKCEFMLDKVGDEFEGVISAVTSFGIFVVLDDIYTEGLVHVTALKNDYYHFDPAKHRLMGERTRRIYRLGDRVRVRVMRVDLDERKMDFALSGEDRARPARRRRR